MTVLCTKMEWTGRPWYSVEVDARVIWAYWLWEAPLLWSLCTEGWSLIRLLCLILERGVVTNAGRDPLLHRRPDPEPSISHLAGLGCNYKGAGVWIASSLRGSFKDWVKNAQKDCRLYISVPGRNCREVLLSSCCPFPEDLESFWLLHFSSLPYFPPLSEFCFCWLRQGVVM